MPMRLCFHRVRSRKRKHLQIVLYNQKCCGVLWQCEAPRPSQSGWACLRLEERWARSLRWQRAVGATKDQPGKQLQLQQCLAQKYFNFQTLWGEIGNGKKLVEKKMKLFAES